MSLLKKIGRVVSWPVRAPVNAAKSAAEDIAMEFVKQFLIKAIYGFLAAMSLVLTQAGGIHSDDKATAVVWSLVLGALTGLVALLKKAVAHMLGVDASQTKG